MTSEEKQTNSSLSMIALEYESDLDNEDDNTFSNTNTHVVLDKSKEMLGYVNINTYRVTGEEKSFTEESSSEDEDSDSKSENDDDNDSSNSSTSDNNDNTPKKKFIKKNNRESEKTKIKSELDNLPLIKDLKISVPEDSCDLIGEVSWFVEPLVIVRPKAGKPTLNLETVLFVDKGKRTLGRIYDVFGQVSDPYYSIRFNSYEHIKKNEIKVGMEIYYCPNSPFTSLVFLHELVKMKGTDVDADAIDNGELPDFSDDEEESKYFESMKQKTIAGKNSSNEIIPFKRARKSKSGWKSNHPWNRNTRRNFQRNRSQIWNNNSATSDSYNRPQNLYPNYSNNQFHGYMPYSNKLETNGTNNMSIPNPRVHFGMFPGFQPIPSAFNGQNKFSAPDIRYSHKNIHLQSQQVSYANSLLPFVPQRFPPSSSHLPSLSPPPPPPLPSPYPPSHSSSIEQNHDASQ